MKKSLPLACAVCLTVIAGASLPFTASALSPEAAVQHAQASVSPSLQAAVEGTWRSADNVARDQWRHPAPTLAFFGVKPQHHVIEITPGGGWYAEILAPYLRDEGRYIAAVVDPQTLPEEGRGRSYSQQFLDELKQKFAAAPEPFNQAKVHPYNPAAPVFAEPGSVDVVLTFRNVHNWRFAGQADKMFTAFFDALKPGGILGVVEHRASTDVADDDRSGYVSQEQVIALAQAAGFVLEASSEINANPRDTKDHPDGVWMLPPSNKHEADQAEKFQAIGESDRMTLRFLKPAN